MSKITYTNKVALNQNSNIADINKVKADDMNEIKSVVNGLVVNSLNGNETERSPSVYQVNDKVNGTILYNNTTGTNADIILSETSANFKYIDIEFRNGDYIYSSVRCFNPNGKKYTLMDIHNISANNLTYATICKVFFNGTTLNIVKTVGGQVDVASSTNTIMYITLIIGYK